MFGLFKIFNRKTKATSNLSHTINAQEWSYESTVFLTREFIERKMGQAEQEFNTDPTKAQTYVNHAQGAYELWWNFNEGLCDDKDYYGMDDLTIPSWERNHPQLKPGYSLPDSPPDYDKPCAFLSSTDEFERFDFISYTTYGYYSEIEGKIDLEWPWIKGFKPKSKDWRAIGFCVHCDS